MPRKKKKQTQAQKEYKKEQQRIKRFIRRAQERGYIFPDNVLPPTPKRITKASVQKLKKIRPEQLYAKAYYADYDTGEVISGTKRRKQERSQSAIRSSITRQRKRDELEKSMLRHEMEAYDEPIYKESELYSDEYYDTDFQAPPTSRKEPPDTSIVDKIHEAISRLPGVQYEGKKTIFIDPYKDMLDSLLDDRIDVSEDIGQLNEYIDYLTANESKIFEMLEPNDFPSTQAEVYNQLTNVANIIKGAVLSPAESKEFEGYLQFYENYELPI